MAVEQTKEDILNIIKFALTIQQLEALTKVLNELADNAYDSGYQAGQDTAPWGSWGNGLD